METKVKSTREAILEQLHESTGTHFLDSGGMGGRHWQRNQSKTWEDFTKTPVTIEAHVYTHGARPELELLGYISVACLMEANLEYDQGMQDQYEKWCDLRDPDNEMYDMQRMELFADTFGGKTGWGNDSRIQYTYNMENDLSQDIQFIEWVADVDECEESFVLVQLHQGCAARGGMGSPKAYRLTSEYWGRWSVDMWGCDSRQWDESGNDCNDSKAPSIKDYPVTEFVYESNLKQDLEALAQTDKDTPEVRAAMAKHAETVERGAFEEFCEALEEHGFVVWKHKAWFVGDDGPEEVYGDCSGLYN